MLAKDIIGEILNNINFRNPELDRNSYYLLNKNRKGRPIQIRISNHGTFLATWVDMANGKDSKIRLVDPSLSINISIVFVDENNNLTKDCSGQSNCENCTEEICKPSIVKGISSKNRQYDVLQFIYNSNMIKSKYLKSIIKAIRRASFGGRYIDPLRNHPNRNAMIKSMVTQDNSPENKLNLNCNFNMKQRIRLTESQLHKIIKNVVNETLGRGSSDDNMTTFESSHVKPNSREFTVIANFFDYTYCFKKEIIGTFDNYNEAKEFALEKIRDKDFMYDLAEDAYAEMEDDDETSIDDINFEIFDGKTSIDSPYSEPIFVTKGYTSLQ